MSEQAERQGQRALVVAEHAGTCFGVERALGLVEEAMSRHPGRVRTLGSLIHNPRVVRELDERGVHAVARPSRAAGCVLVLRSHGVTPEEEAEARSSCSEVIDATCPFVKRVHRAVEGMAERGLSVVVAGEAAHPEVRATCAHAQGTLAAGTEAEALSLPLPQDRPVGVVAQTTLERWRLEEVAQALESRGLEVEVEDTICRATKERQDAACELASRADAMLILGGRSSANTAHLAELCARRCERTLHLESADELDASWLPEQGVVGIAAGASTPKAQIDELASEVRRLWGLS